MDEESAKEAAEGRRSWAESIQLREANRLSATLAQTEPTDPDRTAAHLEEYHATLRKLFGERFDAGSLADYRVLEQLHELDEPTVRTIVEMHVEQLVRALQEAGEPAPPPITVSSLPSGAINAICAKDPVDGSLHIFADAELLTFIQSSAKLVCACLSPVQVGEAAFAPLKIRVGRIHADPRFLKRVVDLFHAVVFTGRARVARPWIPDGMTLVQSVFLTWAMERFAIAHELAHGLDGHLDGDSLSANDKGVAFGPDQEIRADLIATRLCDRKAVHGVYPELEALGPYILLKAVALLEACQAVFSIDGPRVSISHPASAARLDALTSEYLATVPDLGHKIIRLRIVFELDQLFEAWRAVLVPGFEALKAKGEAPSIDRTFLRPRFEKPDFPW